jgi:signal transduction histidine kinase
MEQVTVTQDTAFYQQVAAAGPGFVAIVRGSDLRLLFVNKFFELELDCTNEEVGEKEIYFTDFLTPFQHDRLKHQMLSVKDAYNKSIAYVIYHLSPRNTDRLRPYYFFAAPMEIKSDTGEDIYKILMMPDLSQWTMPFTSFETRELFLEHFQSEDFGTFEWLIGVDRAYWSEGLYRIYEVDPSEKNITRDFAGSFIHPEDRARAAQQSADAISQGKTIDFEFRLITAKGNHKIVHSLAKLVYDKQGNRVKLVGSVRDITNQRSIENDLKHKVDELYQSNKELEEFAYVASHDLQEPLRKITTFSSRLMERYKEALTGEGEMYLTRMNASAENMRTLINDLLEFSRVANAQQPATETDLRLVVKMVKADLELIIEETSSTISIGTLPVIEAIPAQMKQLFQNMIGNAIKFRRKDVPPLISITSQPAEPADIKRLGLNVKNRYYCITIADNGIGFEKEYAQKIFNIFQRLHGKAEYPGSGIGLAVCKKIVEHMGGAIYAESVRGEGSTFTIIIPEKQNTGSK